MVPHHRHLATDKHGVCSLEIAAMNEHEGFTTSFTGAVGAEILVLIFVFVVIAILVNLGPLI